ncbi:IclR family transcriptional regulator [Virgibacillus sp. JSM 102003]|uniref:IclR family transcriptional regulator n=1 Tax=Virgibacillus sp. JSM 102003 TaxID=1562108 RepID=UPI0035C2136E
MNYKILQLFHTHGTPLHIDLILNETDVPRSSLYRHIKNLIEAGLIEAIGKGMYAPGWLADEISRVKRGSLDPLIKASLPIMQEINRESGESVNLTVVNGSKVRVLAHFESMHNLKFSFVEGQILDIFKGASSKVLLANLEEKHRQFLIESNLTHEEGEVLNQEIEQIRKVGYSITNSEVDDNAIGISVPILKGGKYVLGGLSIAGPAFRIKDDNINTYIEKLKEGAIDIALHLE